MFNSFFKKIKKTESADYWETRYRRGGNSGLGSYNELAQFKADVINDLLLKHELESVIEFGCGDGNQLSMLKFEQYIGLDVSVSAIGICRNRFCDDKKKSFFVYHSEAFEDKHKLFQSDVSMSLDVLYHLTEQHIYLNYLKHLFQCASKMVIIYGVNRNLPQTTKHEFYREFVKDIDLYIKGWKLIEVIKNKYPAKDYDDGEGSMAEFFIYTPI